MIQNKVVLVGDCHRGLTSLDVVLKAEEPFDFFLSVGDIKLDIEANLWYNKGYGVKGNHDEVQPFQPLGLSRNINGLKVSGLDGTIKTRTFMRDMFNDVLAVSHQDVDILVTHQPPKHIFEGYGEDVLTTLVQYVKPRLYIFGHTHKYRTKFHGGVCFISLPNIEKGYAVAYFEDRKFVNLEVVINKNKRTIRV
jgi:predicted phosphodiesterase